MAQRASRGGRGRNTAVANTDADGLPADSGDLATLLAAVDQASSQGFWDSAEGQQAAALEARQCPGNGGSLRTKHTRKSQTSGRMGSGALVAAADAAHDDSPPQRRSARAGKGRKRPASSLEEDLDFALDEGEDLDEEPTMSGVELEEDDEGDGSPGNKKKIGRPRKYDGPLDNPNLTEPERRRIKRRIANRESAARVRNRRTVLITELHDQVQALGTQKEQLQKRVMEVERERGLFFRHTEELRRHSNTLQEDNGRLLTELNRLRQAMKQDVAPPAASEAAAGPSAIAVPAMAPVQAPVQQQPPKKLALGGGERSGSGRLVGPIRLDSNASLSEMWASMLHGDPSGIERISSEQAALPEAQAQSPSLPPLAAAAGVANLPSGSLPPLPISRTISSGITSAFEPWKGGGSSTSGAAARPGGAATDAGQSRGANESLVQGVLPTQGKGAGLGAQHQGSSPSKGLLRVGSTGLLPGHNSSSSQGLSGRLSRGSLQSSLQVSGNLGTLQGLPIAAKAAGGQEVPSDPAEAANAAGNPSRSLAQHVVGASATHHELTAAPQASGSGTQAAQPAGKDVLQQGGQGGPTPAGQALPCSTARAESGDGSSCGYSSQPSRGQATPSAASHPSAVVQHQQPQAELRALPPLSSSPLSESAQQQQLPGQGCSLSRSGGVGAAEQLPITVTSAPVADETGDTAYPVAGTGGDTGLARHDYGEAGGVADTGAAMSQEGSAASSLMHRDATAAADAGLARRGLGDAEGDMPLHQATLQQGAPGSEKPPRTLSQLERTATPAYGGSSTVVPSCSSGRQHLMDCLAPTASCMLKGGAIEVMPSETLPHAAEVAPHLGSFAVASTQEPIVCHSS